ncbi:MAG: ComEC/Rec2 family competence protein [Treponema sp.]|jgi:competence protein ComEC|nr:ComEC/Rec2 family competence protein [Treponema sp.]
MVNQKLTPVLCAALGAALGFYLFGALVSAVLIVSFISLTALCLFRVLASLSEKSRQLRLTAVYSAVFAAGLFLGVCAAKAGRSEINFGIPENKITAVKGVLLEDPRLISGGRAMASVSLRECAGNGGLRVRINSAGGGELTVFFPEETAARLREFGRGTTVYAEGKLRESSIGGWTFRAESLHIVKPASAVERMRTGVRLNLIARLSGSSWGGLALALLVGIKDNLDTSLAALYRNAGCSYILALSGMHLAVLASLISLFLKKPLGLKAASIAGAVIIIIYCFIVGPMPSLNRAAVMYLLGVLAVLGAFPKEPMSILGLSFLIQIVISPASGNSISFILSYLALTGILIIGQPMYSLFAGKAPDFLLRPLTASCGAFLATAGVICFTFGILAPVGIAAGLALVPLTTVFMVGSLAWLILDIVSFSFILNLPLSLIYRFMEKIVSIAGGVPGISVSGPLVYMALSLVLSLFILWFEYRRRMTRLALQPFS